MKKHIHKHDIEAKERFVFIAPLLAVGMHIFCCGIPITLALLSGLFGISPTIPFFEETPYLDFYIFTFSGILLALSFFFYLRTKSCCPEHKRRKHLNKIVLLIATAIFFISLFLHLTKVS